MTLRGDVVSSELAAGGILGIGYQCFFQTFPRTIIFMFVLAMFYLHIILKKMECHKDLF
jgi:hypothetical protein